jgi:periplasmic protein TonB
MTVLALTWFEDEDSRDLKRWAMAAAVVVAVHLGAFAAYVYVHETDEIGDESAPIALTLAPDDIDQPEIDTQPEVAQQKKADETPPPPDAVALPEEKQVIKPENSKPQVAPTPARTKGGAPAVTRSWEADLVRHLQQYKRYPGGAQARNEEGVVLLAFSVDRDGHVLNRHIVQSSGHADLDNEVMQMLQRAQPLPAFPAGMTQAQLSLTVPIRFSLH